MTKAYKFKKDLNRDFMYTNEHYIEVTKGEPVFDQDGDPQEIPPPVPMSVIKRKVGDRVNSVEIVLNDKKVRVTKIFDEDDEEHYFIEGLK